MSDVKTLKVDSIVGKHNQKTGLYGRIESKILAQIIGKQVIEVKYKEQEK